MKIKVSPNLVISGYEGRDSIEFMNESVTLLDVLNQLSAMSKNRIKFLRPNGCVSRDDFLVKINGNEVKGEKDDLQMELNDGDTVAILFETLGG